MYVLRIAVILVFIPVFLSCKTISNEAKDDLAKPVNCATAQQDIAALEAEKASAAKQMASGVRSILPAAAVTGILSGDYKNRAKVASGSYNRDLDAKIAEIKQTCEIR